MSNNDSQRSLFKRLVTILGAAHLTLSSKSAVAAATTGAAAALTSAALGFDPLAWGIGGLGGAFIYLRDDPSPRKEVAANLILSILLGGIASPVAYAMASTHYQELKGIPGQYLIAMILCFGWPQLSKLAVSVISKHFGNAE